MKYLLKVELDGDRKPVFIEHVNVNTGEVFYFARGYDGFIDTVSLEWVLENASDILNLSVDKNGNLHPKVPKVNSKKCACLISSYEVDDEGLYITAVALPSDSTGKTLVQFYAGCGVAPEIYLYGMEADIGLTQNALDEYTFEHIAEYKWNMLERYHDSIYKEC